MPESTALAISVPIHWFRGTGGDLGVGKAWMLDAMRPADFAHTDRADLTTGTDAGQNNVDLLRRNGAKAAKRCLRRRRRRNLGCSALHFDLSFRCD